MNRNIESSVILLLLTACLPLPAAISAAEPAKRPNILFIIVDDQSPFDFKFYNPKSSLQTPHIDRLAAQGMVFDAAHHMGSFSGAVCTPSRHMVMSGRTVWHLPIGPGAASHCPPHLEQSTLAAVFNRAGYDTMRTCKIGNSYPGANQQFTVVRDATKRGGTDETGSTWHGDQVLNYLNEREATKDADPFLIYFGFSHPHDTRDGRPELLAKYGATNHTDKDSLPPADPKQPELPVNYLPEHPFPHGHPGLRDEVAVSGVWEKRDERTIRNEIGRQYACSENIDIQVGRVLAKLDAMGELDNTYVFYTADHGMAIGRHGLQGKQNLYEHTWRVPFVVQGPGIKPGSRVTGNIYLLDVLATLCDIADISAPASNEGISFKPVLEGKQTQVRDVLYGAYCGGTKPGMRCVKQGDWKLIKYDVLDGAVHETQLFNLSDNPHELLKEHRASDPALVNLAGKPEFATRQAEMEALLLAEMRRLDDPYRLWNQPDDGLKPPPEAAPRANQKKKQKAPAKAKKAQAE
jgi:choline-sulfatase